MDIRAEAQRSPLAAAVAALVALGALRALLKAGGLLVLTGVVLATVLALTLGVVALRLALG